MYEKCGGHYEIVREWDSVSDQVTSVSSAASSSYGSARGNAYAVTSDIVYRNIEFVCVSASSETSPRGRLEASPVRASPPNNNDAKASLEDGDILAVIVSHKEQLARCAEEQRRREGGGGRLIVRWTVDTSGFVKSVSVVNEELDGTYMASCVRTVIEAMQFPRHEIQREPIQMPFKF